MNYIVRKAFKYGGKILKPGEEFNPSGGKHDEEIVEQGVLVARVDSRINQRHLLRFAAGTGKTAPRAKTEPVHPPKKFQVKTKKAAAKKTRRPGKEVAHA